MISRVCESERELRESSSEVVESQNVEFCEVRNSLRAIISAPVDFRTLSLRLDSNKKLPPPMTTNNDIHDLTTHRTHDDSVCSLMIVERI